MWKFLLPFAAFVALVVLFAFGLNPNRDIRALPSPLIGKAAPIFTLTDVLDPARQVGNCAMKGQVYVFNVWGTWCVGCRQEHQTLLAISQQHVVPILGLDWKDDRDKASQWLTALGNPYQAVAFDSEGRTAIDWGVYGAPETFVVDGKGIIRFKVIGALTDQIISQQLLPEIEKAKQGS